MDGHISSLRFELNENDKESESVGKMDTVEKAPFFHFAIFVTVSGSTSLHIYWCRCGIDDGLSVLCILRL